MDWEFVGVAKTPMSQIQEKNFDSSSYPIKVFESLDVKENCNWRIYLTYPDRWHSDTLKAGDTIYFADPMALHCGDARINKEADNWAG